MCAQRIPRTHAYTPAWCWRRGGDASKFHALKAAVVPLMTSACRRQKPGSAKFGPQSRKYLLARQRAGLGLILQANPPSRGPWNHSLSDRDRSTQRSSVLYSTRYLETKAADFWPPSLTQLFAALGVSSTMASRTLVYVLFYAHIVSAMRISLFAPRDNAPFVPQRVDIPLSFDSQGRYVAGVSMVGFACSACRVVSAQRPIGHEPRTAFQLHPYHPNRLDLRSGHAM